MYRALFTADIHCNNHLPYAKRDAETMVTDRLEDTLKVLDSMREHAEANSISDIWILGDLIDKRLVDAITLKLVTRALRRLQTVANVRLIPGNHESYDSNGRHFVLDAFEEGMDIMVAPVGGDSWVVNGIKFAVMPYCPDRRVTEWLTGLLDSIDRPTVPLLHQTIQGAAVGGWKCPDGIEPVLLDQFEAVLSGHFHTPQRLSPVIRYLGAPIQHTFGDKEEVRGYWDIEMESDGTVKSESMVEILDVPRFHEWVYASPKFKAEVSSVGPGDYVKLRVRAPEADISKRMRQANDFCESLLAAGARYARAVAEPQAQGTTKARAASDGGKLVWSQMVSRYLDECDIGGLSRERLEELGRSFIEDAEA